MVMSGGDLVEGDRAIRKILLFSVFLFSFGVVMLGTASAQDAEDYAGAEACKPCHDKIYNGWTKTGHFNERGCVECHTTGGKPDGSYILKKIQCEMCHGPGKAHVASEDKGDIVINWSADLCGQCHRGSHFPYFEEWEQSAHAMSLREDGGSTATDQKCQGCHVSWAVVSRFEGKEMGEGAEPEPVDCQTCHDPHGSEHERNLRFPVGQLCVQCHNSEGAEIGGKAYHPQAEMLSGSIMHSAGIACYNCHKYIKVYESELAPRVTGHTFEPRPEGCVNPDCHPGKDVKWAKNAIRLDQYEIKQMLEEAEHEISILDNVLTKLYPEWDGTKESVKDAPEATQRVADKYIQARHDIDFVKEDRSFGVHNRAKAEATLMEVEPLVDECIEILRTEVTGAKDVIPPEETTGVGACGPSAVLLLAMLPAAAIRLRKKR